MPARPRTVCTEDQAILGHPVRRFAALCFAVPSGMGATCANRFGVAKPWSMTPPRRRNAGA